MEIYQESGKTGRKYYVFSRKKKPEIAIAEAAHEAKEARANMVTIPVWVDGDTLYTEPTRGAVKMMAVTRKGAK